MKLRTEITIYIRYICVYMYNKIYNSVSIICNHIFTKYFENFIINLTRLIFIMSYFDKDGIKFKLRRNDIK